MNELIDKFHRTLSKWTWAVKIFVKIRNQMNCVIALYLGETENSALNGEVQLMGTLAPYVNVFVDAGANVGDWTADLLQRAPNAQGFCFEPSAQCAERLRSRFDGQNITLFQMALSDRKGKGSFFEEEGCGQTSSLSGQGNAEQGSLVQVPVSTLDAELQHLEMGVDLLKTDCEGWDGKVLMGGGELLKRVRFVQFEYNSSWLAAGSSLCEVITFLETHGFQVFLIRSSGLHPFRYSVWGDFFRYSNFFACRKEDLPVISSIVGDPV